MLTSHPPHPTQPPQLSVQYIQNKTLRSKVFPLNRLADTSQANLATLKRAKQLAGSCGILNADLAAAAANAEVLRALRELVFDRSKAEEVLQLLQRRREWREWGMGGAAAEGNGSVKYGGGRGSGDGAGDEGDEEEFAMML